MIRGLIFDFDGLILDTETPEFTAWEEAFTEHGATLDLATWAVCIGSADAFDPYALLEEQIGQPVDREKIRAARRARFAELMGEERMLPGVADYIDGARELGLKLGVASSSDRAWVTGHLERLGLIDRFDCVKTRDDVARAKPDPALYALAVRELGIAPGEAIALEDSPNGIASAKRAGLFCVVIPNAMTHQLALGEADLRLDSLADLALADLIANLGGPTSST